MEKKEGQRFEGPGKWKARLGARETRGNGNSSIEESENRSSVRDKPVN